MKRTVLLAYLFVFGALAFAQYPTVDKTSVAFTYQYNSTSNSLTAKVTAKLTSTTTTMTVDYTSTPPGWLSVTPLSGTSPLVLAVTANPTSLPPGTYTGTINVQNGTTYTTPVAVTLTITNPASSLLPSFPSTTVYTQTGATTYTVPLSYTSGGTAPKAEVDIGTTGDIIPFTATTAVTKAGTGTVANWLRVNTPGSVPAIATSGVAAGSSIVPIYVTLDQSALNTLDAISYTGTITIAPVKTGSSSSTTTTTYTVTITLSVSPGTPVLCIPQTAAATADASCNNVQVPVFPGQVPVVPTSATATAVPPILTLYGDNFFYNGSWVFYQRPDLTFHALPTTWVSREILTATIPILDLTPPTQVNATGETWSIVVVNGAPGTDPSNAHAVSSPATFGVTDPTMPNIQAVVNAASYLAAATQLPLGTPPPHPYVVSPREIVSIFGQNLGPTSICSNSPTAMTNNGTPLTDANGNPLTQYGTSIAACPNVAVAFTVGANPGSPSYTAPLIMATANQINAIVPAELGQDPSGNPVPDGTSVTVTVANNSNNQATYSVVKMSFDPGIFTFGGNGQGQAAVLNVDPTTGAVTVNGATAATKGSAIEIFATGLGDLVNSYNPAANPPGLADGQVALTPVLLAEDSYRVLIGGQSAPIFYAGTGGNSVAGLVQLNAIVPPGTTSGTQTLTVEIGPVDPTTGAVTARRSQTGVTINVK